MKTHIGYADQDTTLCGQRILDVKAGEMHRLDCVLPGEVIGLDEPCPRHAEPLLSNACGSCLRILRSRLSAGLG